MSPAVTGAPGDTRASAVRVAVRLLAIVAGLLLGGALGALGAAFFGIRCPGAAAASPQASVCGAVGGAGQWGIFLSPVLGLLLAVLVARRLGRQAWWVGLSLLLPVLAPALVWGALELPSGSCAPEDRARERAQLQQWRNEGRTGPRPDLCSAYQGDL